MALYILLLLITVLGCIYSGNNKKREIICSAIIISILLILCGLRGINCGTDNINYLRIFTTHDFESFEYGFIASYFLIPNFQLWLFLYAAFTYMILFFQLKKETTYMCLGILIYMISTTKFFPETFNIIRQALAASIMLWAFISWKNSKKLETFIAIAIATLFHTSSIIALPFLLLKYIRLPYWLCVTAVIITVGLGMTHIINDTLQLFALGITEFNSSDSTAELAAKYASYGNDTSFQNANAMLLNTVPITGMAILTYPFSKDAKNAYGFYYNIFILATIIGNIFIPAMVYGFRLVFSLQIVQVLVLPLAYQYYNKLGRQLITCYLILLSIVYLYYLHLLSIVGIRSIIPYKFIDDIQFVLDSFIN